MIPSVTLLVPGPPDLLGLAAILVGGLLMMLAGRVLSAGKSPPELCLFLGWGGLSLVMTLWGVATAASLYIPAGLFAAGGAAVLAMPRFRPTRDDWIACLRIMVLSLPILALMASARPALPDTFTNFLPNAVYLFDHGVLPADGRPPSISVWPAFPYNLQFGVFLGTLFTPEFPPGALAHFNILLQLMFGLFLARIFERGDADGRAAPRWSSCALGLLLTTVLNPGFAPKIAFSSYAEPAIAVTLALATWRCSRMLEQLAAGRPASRDIWLLSLLLIALVGVKQVAVVLMCGMLFLTALVALADHRISTIKAARALAVAALPAMLIHGAWRAYVLTRFATVPHDGELKLNPFDQWDIAILPATLHSIGHVIATKAFFFLCVAALLGGAAYTVRRYGLTLRTRLLLVSAGMFPFYTAFLLFVYVAHMGGVAGADAHSYYRYNTHLSLLLALCATLFLGPLWRRLDPAAVLRRRQLAAAAAITLLLASPFIFLQKLRFDLAPPQPLIWDLAKAIAQSIEPGEKLAVLLPGDNGTMSLMLRAVLELTPPRREELDFYSAPTASERDLGDALAAGYRHAFISCVATERDGARITGAALLRYVDGAWMPERLLPYPAISGHLMGYLGEPLCGEPTAPLPIGMAAALRRGRSEAAGQPPAMQR